MNKKELYNKVLQLDALTNEEKSELLGLLRKQKRYGLEQEDDATGNDNKAFNGMFNFDEKKDEQ